MRTTLTIDDDVAFGLKKAQENDPARSFKEIVNDLLRRGLNAGPGSPRKKKFKVKAYKIGLRKDLNFDNIEEVLDILEGPNRKWSFRTLIYFYTLTTNTANLTLKRQTGSKIYCNRTSIFLPAYDSRFPSNNNESPIFNFTADARPSDRDR